MCLNSKKPEQDFLLGTKSKRIWTEGILQGSTARIGRLQQGRLSWPRAEHSLAGAVRHCQMRRGRRTEVPFTPLPTGCRGREASCSGALRGMYDPILMGMLMALLASAHTFQRGSGKGPASERDGVSLFAFPGSAQEGASKHQPLQRWDSKQLFCDQDSNRLQDIHLDTSIF